jgi:hypothetical protein
MYLVTKVDRCFYCSAVHHVFCSYRLSCTHPKHPLYSAIDRSTPGLVESDLQRDCPLVNIGEAIAKAFNQPKIMAEAYNDIIRGLAINEH